MKVSNVKSLGTNSRQLLLSKVDEIEVGYEILDNIEGLPTELEDQCIEEAYIENVDGEIITFSYGGDWQKPAYVTVRCEVDKYVYLFHTGGGQDG